MGSGWGNQSNPVSFTVTRTDWRIFSIPISNWCRRGSPIVDEEPTKTVFGPVIGPEESRNRYKIADIGDYFSRPGCSGEI